MVSVVKAICLTTGQMDGKVNTQIDASITLGELLKHVPGAKDFFSELDEKGWQYYFIDGYGTVEVELAVSSLTYTFQQKEHPRGGFNYGLSVDFGRRTPKLQLKSIFNLQRFVVNICSKYYPRAVTIDLTKNEITYVHESLWVAEGAEGLEEAKGVLEILQWLIEVEKFKLAVRGGKEKYQDLVALLGEK